MSSRDLLYNTVLMVNNALLCIKKKLSGLAKNKAKLLSHSSINQVFESGLAEPDSAGSSAQFLTKLKLKMFARAAIFI